MSPESAAPSAAAEAGPDRGAGFGIRFVARLVDTVVGLVIGLFVGVVVGVVCYALTRAGRMDAGWQERLRHFSVLGFLIGLVGGLMYHTVAEGIASTSLGKLICGLRVVDREGCPIGLSAALTRSVGYLVDALFFGLVGYESMKKSALSQRYGDVWAETVVVKTNEFPPASSIPVVKVVLGLVAGIAIWAFFLALQSYVKVW